MNHPNQYANKSNLIIQNIHRFSDHCIKENNELIHAESLQQYLRQLQAFQKCFDFDFLGTRLLAVSL